MNDGVNSADKETRKPRPGPVIFQAESMTNAAKTSEVQEDLGPTIGGARGPRQETAKGSKDLRVIPLYIWVAAGLISVVVGIIFNLWLSLLGLVLVGAAIAVSRANRTAQRFRKQFFESESN